MTKPNSTRTSNERRKIKIKRGVAKFNTGQYIHDNKFQYTGNVVDPDILFVVDPLITDFNKNFKKAIDKRQVEFMGGFLKGAVEFNKVAFVTAAPPCDKLTNDRDKAIGDHLKENRETFVNICNHLKPKLIVPMGKNAARQIYGRAVKITKIRGLPEFNEGWNRPILPSLGIMHVMRYPENQPLFKADMETLKRIVQQKYQLVYKEKKQVNYRWVDDLQFLIDMKPELLSVDIEGVGLNMMDPETAILTVQFCWDEGEAVAIDIRDAHPNYRGKAPKMSKNTRKLIAQMKTLLERKETKIVGQNFKFDFGFLREKLGITVASYWWDTIVMAHIIDENMLTFNLDDLVRRFVPDMSGYADEFNLDPIHQGKTRMDLVPKDKMLQYGCGDVDAVWRLFHVLKDHFDSDPYFNNYYEKVTRPALRAFCDIERNGFTVDINELRSFEKYLRKEQADNYKKIVKLVPPEIKREYTQTERRRNKKTGEMEERVLPLNITRASFLVAMLFQHPKGLKLEATVFTPSTANDPDPKKRVPSVSTKDHLPYFEGEPFVDEIITYIKNEKLLTTYVGQEGSDTIAPTGFYKYIKDGGIRPSYHLHKTDTGRTASSDPNGQNFPKRGEAAKRYRKMFVAPPGWVLVSADFSQVELRVAAFLANETNMLRYFAQGVDLHSATAARVIGKSLKKFLAMEAAYVADARRNAKPVNFGFLYGMWWRKFMGFARTQYGVTFTEKEAENVRKMFFELYPGLEAWHQQVTEEVMREGYVRSPVGRVRHLPSVYSIDEMVRRQATRQAINSPVQSFGSDLGLMAIGRLHQAGIPEDKFKIIGFIHDDIICMAKEEYAVLAARTLKKYMESNPLKEWFDVDMPVKILAEAAIGYNLSDALEANDYLADKSIKTMDDLRAHIKAKLDKLPDTPENERKRKGLTKELAAITRKGAEKAPSTTRRIKLKSKKIRSAINANRSQDKETPRKKIILKRRKKAA